MITNGLPLHILDDILLRLEPKYMAMMRCTNKYFESYLSDPKFGPTSPSWARPSLFNLSSNGAQHIFCQLLVSSCVSVSHGNEVNLVYRRCYIFVSCSGLLLLYIHRWALRRKSPYKEVSTLGSFWFKDLAYNRWR